MLPVRVLIVDDYAPWRNFVFSAFAARHGVKVVCEAPDGRTALQKASKLQPDVVVLDIGLPDLDGIQVARQIQQRVPKVKVLFLTETSTPEIVAQALLTGAHGYVLKSSAARDLIPALEAVLIGGHFVSAGARNPRHSEFPRAKRTDCCK